MIPYDFTNTSEKELLALPLEIQKRIIQKLEFFLDTPNPLTFAKRLTNVHPPSWRFAVGDYRIIFEQEAGHVLITRIGNRKEIYR